MNVWQNLLIVSKNGKVPNEKKEMSKYLLHVRLRITGEHAIQQSRGKQQTDKNDNKH